MVERWLQANQAGEAEKDWRHMADLYTEDATYGWNVGPNDEFMAVGREEIREIALGLEMAGLEGWTYPYQKVLIDEQQGEILGLWKQVADAKKADGTNYEIAGWGQLVPLRRELPVVVAARLLRRRQRRGRLPGDDRDGTLLPGMQQRIERAMSGERLPGHYRSARRPSDSGRCPRVPNAASGVHVLQHG